MERSDLRSARDETRLHRFLALNTCNRKMDGLNHINYSLWHRSSENIRVGGAFYLRQDKTEKDGEKTSARD
jgi:hypothetical protein